MEWEIVMGLEVHTELATRLKSSAAVPPSSAVRRTLTFAKFAPVCPEHFRFSTKELWSSP